MLEIKYENVYFIEGGEYWNIFNTEDSSLYQGQKISRRLVKKVIENVKVYDKKLIAEFIFK